jgi:hypothetical protein
MEPGAGLNVVAKRKKSHHCPCHELNPGRPALSLVSSITELSRAPILKQKKVTIRGDHKHNIIKILTQFEVQAFMDKSEYVKKWVLYGG